VASNLKESLSDFYASMEDKYYSVLDFLDGKGVPVYSVVDAMESKNVPSFPVVLILLTVLLGTVAFLAAGAMSPLVFKVTVIDSITLDPVQGVFVSANFPETGLKDLGQTQEDGVFYIASPRLGEPLRINLEKEGYEQKSVKLVINTDGFEIGQNTYEAGTLAEISLAKETVSFEASFLIKNDDNEVLDGEVTILGVEDTGAKLNIKTTFYTDGAFSFSGFERGKRYVLEFSSDNHYSEEVSVDSESENKQFTVTLAKNLSAPDPKSSIVTLPVTVKNESGDLLAGITVTAKRYDSTKISEGTTYAGGTVSLREIPANVEIQVVATDPEGIYSTERTNYFEIESGQTVERKEITMEKAGDENQIIVEVKTEYFGGISGAAVTLLTGSEILLSETTASSGRVVLLEKAGTYNVSAYKSGYLPKLKKGVSSGSTVSIELEESTTQNSANLNVCVKKNFAAVHGASVTLWTGTDFLGMPLKKTETDGCVSFPDVPAGSAITAKAESLASSGQVSGVEVEAGKTTNVDILLSSKLEKIIVNVEKAKNGSALNSAEVSLFDVETNSEITKDTSGKEGAYELLAPQGMVVYVMVEEDNYLDFVSRPVLVVSGGATVNAKMHAESSDESIDFEGLFDQSGNQKYAVAVDETYRAVFNVIIPKNAEGDSVFMLSVGEGLGLEDSNWVVSGYSSKIDLEVLGGQEFETTSMLSSGGWKWISLSKAESSSGGPMVYQIEVWLAVKSDAEEEDKAVFGFRGNIDEKDIALREEEFLVVAQEELCGENVCFSALFREEDSEEYFPSGLFSTVTSTDFVVEFSAYSKNGSYLDGYKVKVSPDMAGSVRFKSYDIGGIAFEDESDLISTLLEDYQSDLLAGEIKAFSRVVSDGVGIEFEFSKDGAEDEGGVFTVYFDSTGDKLLDVDVSPSTMILEGRNQIKLIVTEAGSDTPVTGASVLLSNKTGVPLGEDVTYSKTGFDDEEGSGKDGEYIFPEQGEFFSLEEGTVNARVSAGRFRPAGVDINVSEEFDSDLKLTDSEGSDSIVEFGVVEKTETIEETLKLKNNGSNNITITVADIVSRNESDDFHLDFKNIILGREIENGSTLDFKMKAWVSVETASDPSFEGYVFVAGKSDSDNKLHITTLPFKVTAHGSSDCFRISYGSGDQEAEFLLDSGNRSKILQGIKIETVCSCNISSFSGQEFIVLSGDTVAGDFELNVLLRSKSSGGDIETAFSKWTDKSSALTDIELVAEIDKEKAITGNLAVSGQYVLTVDCSGEPVEATLPVSVSISPQSGQSYVKVLKQNTETSIESISFDNMCMQDKKTESIKFDLKNISEDAIDLYFKLLPGEDEEGSDKGLATATILEIVTGDDEEAEKEGVLEEFSEEHKLLIDEAKTFELEAEVSDDLTDDNGKWVLAIYIGESKETAPKQKVTVNVNRDDGCVYGSELCDKVSFELSDSLGGLFIDNKSDAEVTITKNPNFAGTDKDVIIESGKSDLLFVSFGESEEEFSIEYSMKREEESEAATECSHVFKKKYLNCSDLNSTLIFINSEEGLKAQNKGKQGVRFLESSTTSGTTNYGYDLSETFVGRGETKLLEGFSEPENKIADFRVNVIGTECTIEYDSLFATIFGEEALEDQPVEKTSGGNFKVKEDSRGFSEVAAMFNGNKIIVDDDGSEVSGFSAQDISKLFRECNTHYCDQTTFKLLNELYLFLFSSPLDGGNLKRANIHENEFKFAFTDEEYNGIMSLALGVFRDDRGESPFKLGGISPARLKLLSWDKEIFVVGSDISSPGPTSIKFEVSPKKMSCGVWKRIYTRDGENSYIVKVDRKEADSKSTYNCNFGVINLPKYFPLFFAPLSDGSGVQKGTYSLPFEEMFDVEYSNTAGIEGIEGLAGNLSPSRASGNSQFNLFARYVGENLDENRCEKEDDAYKSACLRVVNLINKYDGIFAIMSWNPSAPAGTGQKVSVVVKGSSEEVVENIQRKYLKILEGDVSIDGKQMSDIGKTNTVTPVKVVRRNKDDSLSPTSELIITGLIFSMGSDERPVCEDKDYGDERPPEICFINSGQGLELDACEDELDEIIVEFIRGFAK